MTPFQLTIRYLSRIVHAGAIVAGIALHAVLSSPATAAPAPAAGGESTQLSTPQIEQLVSPIALYPDNLLGQVLMASTYPLEVVEAARWSQENPNLTGQALQDALGMQSWDPAVKALTAAPQTLQMMNEQLQWTQQLGDAFLGQQQDVMNAVQALRQRADATGNLQTTPQQRVTKTARPRTGGGAPAAAPAQIISIEPASPETIYAPIYDPATVYGAWPYADYAPPFYWSPPGYVAAGVIGFGAGVVAGAIWANADWRRNNVNVNVNRFNSFNRTRITSNTWTHNAAHRGAVPYRDRNVAQKFGGNRNAASREAARNRINANTNRAGNKSANTNQAGNKGANTNRAGNKSANTNRAGNKSAAKTNSTASKGTQRSASRADRPAQRPRAADAGRNRAGGAGGGAGQRMANRPSGGARSMGGGGGGGRMGGGGGGRMGGGGGGRRR